MNDFLLKLGGTRGVALRAKLTAAYTVTSVIAMFLLAFMLLPVVELAPQEMSAVIKVLAVVLLIDFVGQSAYNERVLRSITEFLVERSAKAPAQETVHRATADFLTLPRRLAVVCWLFWFFSVLTLCVTLRLVVGTAYLKLFYVMATTMTAALVAFIFQYSLFRRVMRPVGDLLVHYGEGLASLREGFHLSARLRLMVTFLLLVLSALTLAGLMSYGLYLKLTGEQAGILAGSSLENVAGDLPSDRSKWADFVRERIRYEDYDLAIWDRESDMLIGNLPVPFAQVKPLMTKSAGSLEDPRTLTRVSYRVAGSVTLVAAVTPRTFLSGGLDIVWVTFAILGITFAFAAFMFNAVTRDIVAPFTQLRRFTTDLAGGRLANSPVVVTDDELDRLDGALREMGGGLRTMFTDLRTGLEAVKTTRTQIGGKLRQIQTRSSDQDLNVDRSFMSFNELTQALRDIADNVEVVEKAAFESKDAAQDMGRYLDDIKAELAELVDTVRGSSRFIFAMTENVEQSSTGVAVLRESVERLRQQIEAVHVDFSHLSGEMHVLLEDSGKASSLSTVAIDVAAQTAEGAAVVKSDTEGLLAKLQDFREGIIRIGGVVSIISDVTEQTALLAFNAAILAAQSQDEHAKDFAVVGDEIKDLAERTESSTKDVGSRMRAIHNQTDISLDEMRASLGLIQQGQLLTVLAQDSVRLINEHSNRNDTNARTISEGIYYQSHNLTEIMKAVDDELKRVENVRGFTEENGQDATALRSSLDGLLDFIRKLQTTTSEQTDGGRHIATVVEHISERILRMRRDIRKLSGGAGEAVQLMNDIRMTSRHNAQQTDDMSSQLKRLDQLLKRVEAKLRALELA